MLRVQVAFLLSLFIVIGIYVYFKQEEEIEYIEVEDIEIVEELPFIDLDYFPPYEYEESNLNNPDGWITKEQMMQVLDPQPDGIYIHLDSMELTLWKDGEITIYPILAIREGFRNFNTPRGDFEALYMTENHLSSLFDVWMPFSVQFSGDYFLHGYPTFNDADRTPVPYGTSGGCIRMNTDDMEEIFNLIDIGTPIIIK